MIRKQDILDRAGEWLLRPDVVEKDYVLGCFLAALGQHAPAGLTWVFKGGTCLKKCFFETFRFSEDLDFTILPEAEYTEEAIRGVISEAAERAEELSGVSFLRDGIVVRPRQDLLGRPTYEVRIGYRGPLQVPGPPRLRLDLTQHEPLQESAQRVAIFHPYPDTVVEGITVLAYTLLELFAEKTRALQERTRPRDLYDVVFMLENRAAEIDFGRARDLYSRKCIAKNIGALSSAAMVERARTSGELRSEWSNMLAHQLPQLPPLDPILDRLAGLLSWLDAPAPLPVPVPVLGSASRAVDEEVLAPAGVTVWGVSVPLEVARFAGANRLMVEFDYDGKHRVAAPYSLRRAKTGNVLLYAWDRSDPHIKAFNVAKIRNLRATDIPFTPRYAVEFTAGGPPLAAPLVHRATRR